MTCWTRRTGPWQGSPGQWTLILLYAIQCMVVQQWRKICHQGCLTYSGLWGGYILVYGGIYCPKKDSEGHKIPLSLLVHFHPWSRSGRASPWYGWCGTASARNHHFQPETKIFSFFFISAPCPPCIAWPPPACSSRCCPLGLVSFRKAPGWRPQL